MFFAATHAPARRHYHAPLGRFLDEALANARQQTAAYTQDETSYTLTLDVPGIAREHLGITIEDAVVRITAKEGAPRAYRAAYEFPTDIDASASDAKLENGVLTLKLAKKLPVRNTSELTIN